MPSLKLFKVRSKAIVTVASETELRALVNDRDLSSRTISVEAFPQQNVSCVRPACALSPRARPHFVGGDARQGRKPTSPLPRNPVWGLGPPVAPGGPFRWGENAGPAPCGDTGEVDWRPAKAVALCFSSLQLPKQRRLPQARVFKFFPMASWIGLRPGGSVDARGWHRREGYQDQQSKKTRRQ